MFIWALWEVAQGIPKFCKYFPCIMIVNLSILLFNVNSSFTRLVTMLCWSKVMEEWVLHKQIEKVGKGQHLSFPRTWRGWRTGLGDTDNKKLPWGFLRTSSWLLSEGFPQFPFWTLPGCPLSGLPTRLCGQLRQQPKAKKE